MATSALFTTKPPRVALRRRVSCLPSSTILPSIRPPSCHLAWLFTCSCLSCQANLVPLASAAMADLAAEILRLTSAPYAVSLKVCVFVLSASSADGFQQNLETILKDSDPYYLRSWADAHPCQVQPFARTVIDALEFCPYALAVVEYTGRRPGILWRHTLMWGRLRNMHTG